MNKIPVGQVIGQTYNFAFRRYWTGLGIVWLPTLVAAAIAYLCLPPLAHSFDEAFRQAIQLKANGGTNQPVVFEEPWQFWLFELAFYAVFVIVAVGITREVLGLRKGPRFVYFWFGAAELRSIAGYILTFIVAYVLLVVFVVGLVIIGLVAAALLHNMPVPLDRTQANMHWDAAVIGFVVAIELAFFFILVRLGYFIVPVAVAERQIGLSRSWELTRGNFWRIALIWLATVLPVLLIEILFGVALMAPIFLKLIALPHRDVGRTVFPLGDMFHDYLRVLPVYWAIGPVLAPVFYGLWKAPAAFAYRALVPAQKPPSEKAAGPAPPPPPPPVESGSQTQPRDLRNT